MRIITGFLAMLCVAVPTLAADITFTSSGEIAAGDNYTNVYVRNNGTIVAMTGGTIDEYLWAYDASTVNVSGGLIGQDLVSSESSTVNVSGGTITYDVNVLDSGTANIYAGASITDDVYVYDSGEVFLYGGTVGDNFQAYASATVTVVGGSIGNNLGAHGSSVMHLHGGQTDYGLWADELSTVTIYGYDLSLTNSEVSGRWVNDAAFQIDLVTADTYTHIELVTIPEPATMGLLGLSGLTLLRRHRRKPA